jgi:hypothetical protein
LNIFNPHNVSQTPDESYEGIFQKQTELVIKYQQKIKRDEIEKKARLEAERDFNEKEANNNFSFKDLKKQA